MLRAFFARLLVAVACLTALAGCGEGDSETRGTLTVSAVSSELTAGLYLIEAQGFYFNADAGGVSIGVPIQISATVETPDGTLIQKTSAELRTDSAGTVSYDLKVPQGAVDSVVSITARYGGLADTTVVVIPALAPITASPAAVSFPGTAAPGSFTTVSISGGAGPYSATVDAAHSADLEVTVSGNDLIITKRTASDATAPVKLATVTVSGANSAFAPLNIGVSYQ